MSTPAVVKAKRFLVNRIVDQAKREDVVLSEVEITMLGFRKASATDKELEAATVFERDYDEEQYQTKIGKLIRNVYKIDKESGREEVWEQSLDSVAAEDMYLSAIIKKSGMREAPAPWYVPDSHTMRELIPTFVMVGAGIVVIFTPLGTTLVPNPILRMVVAVCCWLTPWLISKLSDKQNSEQ